MPWIRAGPLAGAGPFLVSGLRNGSAAGSVVWVEDSEQLKEVWAQYGLPEDPDGWLDVELEWTGDTYAEFAVDQHHRWAGGDDWLILLAAFLPAADWGAGWCSFDDGSMVELIDGIWRSR